MFKGIVSLFLFLILSFLLIRYIELSSIFYPMREIEITPKMMGLDYEDVYFKAEDGVLLNGWLIKKPKAAATLIFFHGNAGNISHRIEKIALFYSLGLNTFIIDYRGYGKSQGRPSEEGIYRDARAAYDYLQGRKDLGIKKIAYGESLGSCCAIDLSLYRKLDGLIVDSAFTSARDMAKAVYPFIPPLLFVSKFDSLKKIPKIKIPKLFIHSRNDEIVPFWQGERLFKAADTPKEFLQITGGHNSGFMESEDLFREKIKNFLSQFNLS